ncbi:MAG: tRNA (adenosine(37)-N6)-threonylcarbamoyltransferase complex dimerization subunit type 1 TsaB, partial [Nitrospira sp.]|nr:tRNA (adenosine(37)-N6)-threonylcarbamoyltransferase complex dimerization subunit type 1 TsaB [Nitrospira sp.]
MKILAIETATTWQSVAILEESRVLARQDQDASGAHGTLLLPAIERLLMETQLRLNDLDGLACSAGPGSFTGIRVGLATCLGLRAATGLPLVLVPTLEAMAWGVTSSVLPICPIVTSRRGELYWAIF